MAHKVKCKYCEEIFDRDKIPFIELPGRRYAHKTCYCNYLDNLEETNPDDYYYMKIHNMMREKLRDGYNKVKIDRQINKLIKEESKNMKGIALTLEWWYDIKKEDPAKANGGIGIVSYIWRDSQIYWKSVFDAQKNYQEISLDNKTVIQEVKANRPKQKARYQIVRPKRVNYFDLE